MERSKRTVDTVNFHKLRVAVDAMQGKVFYCEDEEGVLRRWTPPKPYSEGE